ncbi:MAG: hypothetical protein L6R41_001628 [Letrouitia leprolyta]|nr:MAG: hypothetical protein L6R41_001628 [Letrouitia leprolyta]
MSPSSFLVSSILALSTLTSLPSVVSAQQSASIFIVNADTQPLVGSIVGTKGATTTYQIQCGQTTDSTECGFPGPFTYIKEGSTSIQYAMSYPGLTASIGCSLGGTTTAVCTGSGVGSDEEGAATGATQNMVTQAVSTTLGANEIQFTQIPITGATPAAAQVSGATPTATPSKTASGGSASGQAAASPSGSTGGAGSVQTRSVAALIGAAAMAGLII